MWRPSLLNWIIQWRWVSLVKRTKSQPDFSVNSFANLPPAWRTIAVTHHHHHYHHPQQQKHLWIINCDYSSRLASSTHQKAFPLIMLQVTHLTPLRSRIMGKDLTTTCEPLCICVARKEQIFCWNEMNGTGFFRSFLGVVRARTYPTTPYPKYRRDCYGIKPKYEIRPKTWLPQRTS